MRPGRRIRLLGALAVMVLASGCNYLERAEEHQEASPETRPWWCESTGDGGSHGDGDHAGHYDGVTKGMLSWDDCLTVSRNFDGALGWALQYPTLGDAEAAGFHRTVRYVEGMGTHHMLPGDFGPDDLQSPEFDPHDPVFPGTALDELFDPNRPEFLQYGGNSDDAPLVGMSWYVRTDDGMPPEGFAGDNDWWHVHERLCFTTSTFEVIGENWSDAQCERLGGINLHLHDYWMAHAWIQPPYTHTPDVFVNHHPCLLSSGPAPETDPCWDMTEDGGEGH